MKCKYCGSDIPDDSIFCPVCACELIEDDFESTFENVHDAKSVIHSDSTNSEDNQDWYYADNDKSHGPYTINQMKDFYQSNVINKDTYVWKQGMENWIAFNQSGLIDNSLLDSSTDLSSSDEVRWFYYDGKDVVGPYNEDDLMYLHTNGIVLEDTYICEEGTENWVLFKESQFGESDSLESNTLQDDNQYDESLNISESYYNSDLDNNTSFNENKVVAKEESEKWYYSDQFTHHGPFSEQEILELYKEKVIINNTQVWKTNSETKWLFKDSPLYSKRSLDNRNSLGNSVSNKKNNKMSIPVLAGVALVLIIGIFVLMNVNSKSNSYSSVNYGTVEYEDSEDEDSYEKTYTYIFTDGVTGETVFEDRVYENMSENDEVPTFTPTRDGYTFSYWDRSEQYNSNTILFTAVWDKNVDPDAGYYVTNYVMSIRTGPNRHTTLLREIPQGSTVYIIKVDRNDDGTWGQISDSEWICLRDGYYNYCYKK